MAQSVKKQLFVCNGKVPPCLLADVKPLHDLRMERCCLQLASPSAPQLLYIRHDADIFGLWSPVIGPAPGPVVTPHQEVPAVLANVCDQGRHGRRQREQALRLAQPGLFNEDSATRQ